MTKAEIITMLKKYPAAMSVDDVADALRVSTKLVYRFIANGELNALKVGRAYRISKGDLVTYIKKNSAHGSNRNCVLFANSSDFIWTSEKVCGTVCIGTRKSIATQMKGAKNATVKKHTYSQHTKQERTSVCSNPDKEKR